MKVIRDFLIFYKLRKADAVPGHLGVAEQSLAKARLDLLDSELRLEEAKADQAKYIARVQRLEQLVGPK